MFTGKVRAVCAISLCIGIVGITSHVLAATYYVDATKGKDLHDG